MGLAESTLKPIAVRPLVRPELVSQLPSFSLDTAKYPDGAQGFLVTRTDLAKNSTTKAIVLKFMYRPTETSLVYVGVDDSIVTLQKDLKTGKVICRVEVAGEPAIVRPCVVTYEPIDDMNIDMIRELYAMSIN
jgi:hypothetical protein